MKVADGKLMIYPIITMIEKLVVNGYDHSEFIQDLWAVNTGKSDIVDGSVIDSFMSAMKASGEVELDDYIQVWPLVNQKSVLFAKKDFLLSVIEANPTHLNHVLQDIAFRYVAGFMVKDIGKTPVKNFDDQLFASVWNNVVAGIAASANARSAYLLDVKTIEDLSHCDYQEYFSTAIAWPITDEIEALYGGIGSEGYTYLATIDFIIETLTQKYEAKFNEHCSRARDLMKRAYDQYCAAKENPLDTTTVNNADNDVVNIFSFTESSITEAYEKSGVKGDISVIRQFVIIGNDDKFKCADMLILNITKLTSEISLALKMSDFRLDECNPNRYRLFHNNYQKLFIVAVDG